MDSMVMLNCSCKLLNQAFSEDTLWECNLQCTVDIGHPGELDLEEGTTWREIHRETRIALLACRNREAWAVSEAAGG
eukprot:CAMPEP_0177698036 /NCGR_PEP_ID=MMETSP0484_2-20121128/4826_1 /TAXON_ID=354590 /ORGANISM="Rhodomonas lens, Strain RHODO" /LENGTH=76 /DNA_ID=CAMNT_0019209101 /DNA_START=201 /DNA_END=427 /DNA_ORIENTATION=-